ncbi:hypothetical protein C8R44DRAFT_911989 [Mycena epipterygia]|nr:hypothetical protein C8R44DRAFT_911989 [Mycena epipterygia]
MSAPLIAPNVARARRRKYQRTPSYVAVSNIEDLGRSFTEELRLTRRTCFKNIQGTSEPVWSPKLEAALLQGLYAYHTRYGEKEIARSLKKNLHRNSFISDFLLNTTNMFRTPKQVASRLQQLRVTTKDKHLQSILSRPAPEPVVKPLASTRPLITAGLNRMTVRLPITVILHDALYPSRPEIVLGPSPQNLWFRALHPCSCISGGGDKPYWSSITTLSPDGIHDGKWRYVTAIPADLWEVIVERHRHGGRTRYAQWTMLQLIFRADDKSFTRDNPLAELIYDVRPLDDKKPHPDCDYHTQMSIPKALAAKTRLRDTPRTAESSFFPGGSLSKSQEGASVYSNSGTFIEVRTATYTISLFLIPC